MELCLSMMLQTEIHLIASNFGCKKFRSKTYDIIRYAHENVDKIIVANKCDQI